MIPVHFSAMSGTTTMPNQRSGRLDKKQKRKAKERGWRSAATSDRHELYELSVQDVSNECDLIDQVWQEIRGRTATSIREDFCGTAAASMIVSPPAFLSRQTNQNRNSF